jgi:large repetitive protein
LPSGTLTPRHSEELGYMAIGTGVHWSRAALFGAGLLLAGVTGSAQTSQIQPATLSAGTYNVAYPSTQFTFSGNPPGVTWSWAAQSGSILPPGLNFSTAGLLNGTPTRGGVFNFIVTATRSGFTPSTANYALLINSPPVTITSGPNLPVAVVGQGYNVQLAASGGSPFPSPTPPYFWVLGDGNLPLGLTFGPDGRISGVVDGSAAPGLYNLYVNAYDNTYEPSGFASFQSGFASLTITVDTLPVINDPSNQGDWVRGTGFILSFSVSGGTYPYVFSQTGGTLPAGTTFYSSGFITGTLTTAGTYNFTVAVTDTYGVSSSKAFTVNVYDPLSITTTSPLPNGEQGAAYSLQLTRAGGKSTFAWSVATGSTLPAWLSLSSGGLLTGTPPGTGTFNFTVRVVDSVSPSPQSAQLPVTLVIIPALQITTSTLPNTVVGASYSQTISTTGGQSPLIWSISSGSLPPGLGLVSGVISGAATTPGSYPFTVRAVDALGGVATRSYTIVVTAPLAVSAPSTMPVAVSSVFYSQAFSATGGAGPYVWSLAGNFAVPGLTMSSAGVLSGTPGAPGSYPITVQVTDGSTPTPQTATRNYTVVIDSLMAITTATPLPAGIVGQSYSQTLAVNGGTPAYTWSVNTGSPPAGLGLSTAGVLSGTPTTAANTSFTVQVRDNPGQAVTKTFTLAVVNLLTVTTSSLPLCVATVAYSQSLAAAGGTPSYVWSLSGGSLPAGITLTSAGQLAGTTGVAGSFPIQVRVTDSTLPSSFTATANLTLNVDTPMSIQTNPPIPVGVVGSPYSHALSRTGGTAPFTWSISGGTPPPGISISGSTLTGTPTQAGVFNFTVQVSDSLGQQVPVPVQVTIAAPLTITSASPITASQQGTPYTFTFAATGGIGSYIWTATSTPPPGLSLSSAGGLSGTPSGSGNYTFSVQVTDSAVPAQTTSRSFSLFEDPPIVIQTSTLPAGVAGVAYSATVVATGGTSPYTFSVSPQTPLPSGLLLNPSTGAIGGTTASTGLFSITIAVADLYGFSVNRTYSLRIVPRLLITTTSLPDAREGLYYSFTYTATGGSGSLAWSPSGGLPDGLSLTGPVLSGIPTTPGTFSVSVQVTELEAVVQQTATATLSLTIGPRVAITSASPLPNGAVGKPYSQQLTAAFGTTPYSWYLESGTLPTGFVLSSGAIFGTTNAAGTYSFRARVLDQAEQSASKDFTLTIVPLLSITTTGPLPVGNQNVAYGPVQFAAGGGLAPLAWSAPNGGLPAGLTLSPQGLLSGTPTGSGTPTFTVQVADSNTSAQQTVTGSFTVTIYPAVTITTASPLPGGVTGQSYSQTLQATGGNPPLTWSISGGALPGGWTLSPSGVLSGTTANAAAYSFTARAADGTGGVGVKDFSVTVAPPLAITTSTLPVAFQNSAYTPLTLAATGGTDPFTWSVSTGSLPAGMTLSGAGVLSGTPTAAGSFPFTARVVDCAVGAPQSATKQVTLTVDPQLFITTASPLPYAKGGAAYSQTLALSGGTSPFTWSASEGTLPPGFSLSPAGVLSGTPGASLSATFNFTAQVVDGPGQTVVKAFALQVIPPLAITTASPLPVAVLNAAYTQSLTATGGAPSYTWSLAGGSLPPGISLTSAGVLTGTPATAGNYEFSAAVTDQSPGVVQTAKATFILVADVPITITTTSAGGAVSGKPWSLTLAATGGTGTLAWSFVAPGPAAWFSITSAGVVSGTPPSAGSYDFTVKAADPLGVFATKTLTLQVNAPLAITTTSLPDGVGNVPYSLALAAGGGEKPYAWSVTGGALPPGLTLNSDGSLTGTPIGAGTFNFTAQVKDGSSAIPQTATAPFSLKVLPALAIVSSTIVGPQVGQFFSTQLQAAGGVPQYNWTLLNGGVPGLFLTGGGVFSGTPTLAGTFPVVVRLGDTTVGSVTAAIQVVVAPPTLTILTPSPLPPAVLDLPYAATIVATGATPPYRYNVDSGALPVGLVLAESGAISGTATQGGTFTFAIRASSGVGALLATAVKTFQLTVQQSDLTVVTSVLNSAVLGQQFSQQLVASGGTPPYHWSLAGGTLPPPMTVSDPGLLSGAPGQSGSFSIAVRVADSAGLVANRTFLFTVVQSPLQITTSSLPAGRAGVPYSALVSATGGQPGYTFVLANGTSLPAGVTLAANGAISGTPAAGGAYDFAVTVQDASGAAATKAFTLIVAGPNLSISTASLPEATVNQPYSANVAATGGAPPYQWSASGLPSGLLLNPGTGAISGTPSAAGPSTVSVTVTDGAGATATRVFSLTVKAPPLVIVTSSNLGSVPLGSPAAIALAATGGVQPLSWLILSGNPAGLTLGSSGTLTGLPSSVGTFNFTAQVNDSAGGKDTRQFTLTVTVAPLTLKRDPLPPGSAGGAYNASVGATGGVPPYTFSAAGLPAGLTINPTTGAIGGSPTLAGPFTITVHVTDAGGQTADQTLVLDVSVQPLPPASLTGPPAVIQPLDQPPLRLNINGTMPVPVDGEVRLVFTADRGGADPAVQFATGGAIVRFTIPAGTNIAQFATPSMAVQTGSVAGTIVLTATFRAAGVDVTPTPAPSVTIRIAPAPPGIRSVTAARTSAGITVTVTGFANTRELTSATFRFNPAPGSTQQSSEVTVNVAQLFSAWFADPQSQAYGSQFTFVQPFNVGGDAAGIASVTVTLTNGLGASSPVTANLQ